MARIVVGMSGGVDSSVAAAILKEQGHEVIALFMRNWEETDDNGNCSSEADYNDVQAVCERLDIPYYTVNYAKQYYDRVFTYFLEEYARGRTPNPDVLCNREIKFKPFLNEALALGADLIATGHYAGLRREGGKVFLTKAKDSDKDQTYFLCRLTQEQLSRVTFPLADIAKPQVREIAAKYGFTTAQKKDSTGICFIGERNFRNFLSSYLPAQSGDIVNLDGEIVGRHEGLMYYTIGQRRGLGLGGTREGSGRWFVVQKDMANNRLIVSHGDEAPLMSKALLSGDVNWIPERPNQATFECRAKFRYRQDEQAVNVTLRGDNAFVEFKTPQRAVTEGQFVVFYNETDCLGGAVINEVYK